jgi:coronin-7
VSKFRTASKYRHAVPKAEADKLNGWYLDVNSVDGGEATVLACSSLSLAVNWKSNAGTVALIALGCTGKRSATSTRLLQGHSGAVLDLEFSPFDADLLATASDDASVKLWRGGESVAACAGQHKRGVASVKFHPCVRELLATGSADGTVRLWDFMAGACVASVDLGAGDKAGVEQIAWQPVDGSLLAAVGRDKKLRIVDPRAGQVVQAVDAHAGVKASRVCWLDAARIATSGFSKTRERQLMLWDAGKPLDKPFKTHSIDSSTGVMDLMYDEDAEVLFVCGKGDSAVRTFELLDKDPHLFEMTAARSDESIKGCALLPKRAVRVMQCEVDRCFAVKKDAIVPITYTVPRATKRSFDDIAELFPPSRGAAPSIDAAAWLGGATAPPVAKVSLDPAKATVDAAAPAAAVAAASATTASTRLAITMIRSAEPVNINRAFTSAETGKLEAVVMKSDAELARDAEAAAARAREVSSKTLAARALIRSTHYRHVSGKEDKPELQYDGLRSAASASFARQIVANGTFFAVPLEGNGGQVAVVRHADPGRQPLDPSRVENGSALVDFDFSPFDDCLLLCALENAKVKVHRLPADATGKRKEGLIGEVAAELKGHRSKLATARWHPIVPQLVVSTSLDGSVRVHDITASAEVLTISDAHPDAVLSQTFDLGGSVIATSNKDKKLRLFDLRAKSAVAQTDVAHAGAKSFRAEWMGQHNRIFTAGFSKTSERECAVWDTRKLDAWLGRAALDVSSGILEPMYDEDTNVAFVSGRGDTTIRLFEPVDQPHFLTMFSAGDPAVGVAALPKTMVDVRAIELRRFVKLTASGRVVPIRFTVPRTRPEFFQDDIYVPTRSQTPTQTADEFLAGGAATPQFVDLCPPGMTRLSEAPAVEKKGPKYALDKDADKDKGDVTDSLFKRMNARQGIASIEDQRMQQQQGADESDWDEDASTFDKSKFTPGLD